MDEIELKEKLITIKERNYLSTEDEIEKLIFPMLDNIGSIDGELRDSLIYYTFCKWVENKSISSTQMKRVLDISLNESHLFYKIGEKDTDSIFKRSFSSLLISLALDLNIDGDYLKNDDIRNIKNKIILYFKKEKDFRTYVDGKGWADGIGHGLYVIMALANTKIVSNREMMELLDTVFNLIKNTEYVYICEEDLRLSQAFLSIYKSNLINDKKINDFFRNLTLIDSSLNIDKRINLKINIRNFLYNLYFQLYNENEMDIAEFVKENILKLL